LIGDSGDMYRSPSFWFGAPKEALSATERARLATRRDTRLEQHMLQPGTDAAPRGPRELRDPTDLARGLEVQVLPESEFDRLFPLAPD
jgi:hypothetical protein